MDHELTSTELGIYREKVDDFVRRAGARIARLNEELASALARESQANNQARASGDENEGLVGNALLMARETSERILADARRRAAAIIAEGEGRAASINAEADKVIGLVVSQVQQAIDDARQAEQHQVDVASRDTRARLGRAFDGASRRSGGGPSVSEATLNERPNQDPDRLAAPTPGGGSPTSSAPFEPAAVVTETSTSRVGVEPAHQARDEDFFAELKRAMDDGLPLGPPDDGAVEIEGAPTGSVPRISTLSPGAHSQLDQYDPGDLGALVDQEEAEAEPEGTHGAETVAFAQPVGSGWIVPNGLVCPAEHSIKANLASLIYHLPGMFAYDRLRPDRCYATPKDAQADGLRQAKR